MPKIETAENPTRIYAHIGRYIYLLQIENDRAYLTIGSNTKFPTRASVLWEGEIDQFIEIQKAVDPITAFTNYIENV